MRARGFSLIELAVASAIAGVIAVAAIGAFATLNRQLNRVERETTVGDNAKSVVDLLVSRLQGIGGGAIRPWMATLVDNGKTTAHPRDARFGRPAAITSDRLTYAELVPDAPTCTLVAATAASVQSSKLADGTCCSQKFFTKVSGRQTSTPTQVTVYAISGEQHRQLVIRTPTAACTSVASAGPLSEIDNATAMTTLIGGTLSRARIKTLYLNNANELREFEQFDDFATVDLSKGWSTLVSSDVFDLQFQLGYDRDPDGRIVDRGDDSDEWQFNSTGNEGTFTPSTLRMVGAGVVVGTRTPDSTQVSKAKTIGGAVIGSPYVFLRAATGKAALRNLFVFN